MGSADPRERCEEATIFIAGGQSEGDVLYRMVGERAGGVGVRMPIPGAEGIMDHDSLIGMGAGLVVMDGWMLEFYCSPSCPASRSSHDAAERKMPFPHAYAAHLETRHDTKGERGTSPLETMPCFFRHAYYVSII